jgi:hypothetical protein
MAQLRFLKGLRDFDQPSPGGLVDIRKPENSRMP